MKPTVAKRLIPTKKQQRTSSTLNLYTNGLDLPKFNKMHKAQHAVSTDAPGFKQALDELVIPRTMLLLYTNCLDRPKESFYLSATSHIQIIAQCCGVSVPDLIRMRGWVFFEES